MLKQTVEQYAGYACLRLENSAVSVWITQHVGPRIIGLQLTAGDNLLAVVPDMMETTPSGKNFYFRGGHRLWHAPEDAERTYQPDNSSVSIMPVENGVRVTQPTERLTHIQKQMTITLPDETACVVVDHTLTNDGCVSMPLIPWAITQMRPGGVAILPQSTAAPTYLPNRALALWPYTRFDSPHLQWGDRYIFVHANMTAGKLKIGWANTEGWLAYWVDGVLFVKEVAYQHDGEYVDFGSSSECFCNEQFLELETLAPRTMIEPGATVSHREVWRLYTPVLPKMTETAVAEMIAAIRKTE